MIRVLDKESQPIRQSQAVLWRRAVEALVTDSSDSRKYIFVEVRFVGKSKSNHPTSTGCQACTAA
jgi:hypothetical protein